MLAWSLQLALTLPAAAAAQGYAQVGAEQRASLAEPLGLTVRARAGRCYLLALELDADAELSPWVARRGLRWQVGEGEPDDVDTKGRGGTAELGCQDKDATLRVRVAPEACPGAARPGMPACDARRLGRGKLRWALFDKRATTARDEALAAQIAAAKDGAPAIAGAASAALKVTEVSVDGPLGKAAVERALQARGERLADCHRQLAAGGPREVALTFIVEDDGRIKDVGAASGAAGDPQLRCLQAQVGGLRFPAAPASIVSARLVFAP